LKKPLDAKSLGKLNLLNLFSNFSYETWTLLKTLILAGFTVWITASVAKIWQQRNWLLQQQISDQEKINLETKKLFDDFIELSSKRHFRTKRLFWALKAVDEVKIEESLAAYDEVVCEWNEAELSWKVRFVKNLDFGSYISADIEKRIRMPFVATGSFLERGVRRSKMKKYKEGFLSPKDCVLIETNLKTISHATFEIGRDIYGKLDYLSAERLDENQIVLKKLQRGYFENLSVFQLFKAVITSNRHHQF
jgi:hypothetical protein